MFAKRRDRFVLAEKRRVQAEFIVAVGKNRIAFVAAPEFRGAGGRADSRVRAYKAVAREIVSERGVARGERHGKVRTRGNEVQSAAPTVNFLAEGCGIVATTGSSVCDHIPVFAV